MFQPEPFGRYLLFDRLSTGGMASVYLAKSAGPGGEKFLAIKRILPELSDDGEFTRMFIDEAHISSSLSHANIGQVYDFGQVGDRFYLAMEYIAGRDLRAIQTHLRETGRVMELPLVLHVVARVCQALDYAHRLKDREGRPLGIVHRDVSPPNVLLSFAGAVKLIDFGIAKARSRASRTRAGQLKGKLSYMAPEQVQGQQVDHRGDIFSLGIVMHELLTNQHVFGATDQTELLEQVRQGEIRPPSALNPEVPLEIDRIVLKALCRDREQRYGWASELRADIERYIARTGSVLQVSELAQWMCREFAGDVEAERLLARRLQEAGESSDPPPVDAAEALLHDTEPRHQAPQALELGEAESTLVSEPEFLQEAEVSLPDTEPGVQLAELALQASSPFDSTAVTVTPGLEPTGFAEGRQLEPAAQGELPQHQRPIPELLEDPLEALDADAPTQPPSRLPQPLLGAIAPGPERASRIVGGALDASRRPRRPTPAVDPAQPVDVGALEGVPVERYDELKPSLLSTAVRATGHILVRGRRPLSSTRLIMLAAAATMLLAGLALLLSTLIGGSASSPATGKGSLIVTATPPATCSVTVDGRPKGVLKPGASLSLTGLPVGEHQVGLQCLGFSSYAAQVVVKEAEASFVSGELAPH